MGSIKNCAQVLNIGLGDNNSWIGELYDYSKNGSLVDGCNKTRANSILCRCSGIVN